MPRQKTISITLNLPLFPMSSEQIERLDDWLAVTFSIENLFFCTDKPLLCKTSEKLYFELAYRGQQLSNKILQLTNIPAFFSSDDIQLIKDDKNLSTLKFSIPLAFIELTDNRAYEITVASAFEILYWMISSELNQTNLRLLYKVVEQKINKPLEPYFTGWVSTLPILKAAHDKNIPFIHMGSGDYQLGWGHKAGLISNSANEHDSALGARISQNKIRTVKTLEMAGLPTTRQLIVNSEESANSAVGELGWPIIVKPSSRDRGEGVTININNKKNLSSAYKKALKLSPNKPIIIEKMLSGTCHRLFISNYTFLYCAKRWPLSVQGDGLRTVAQLISESNDQQNAKAPWLRSKPYPMDAFATKTMGELGYTLKSIPKIDDLVPLRPFQSDEWGGSPEDVTITVHPDNINVAVRTARLFGLYNCGVDFMSSDISQPWYTNGAAIIEVNFTPELGVSSVSQNYVAPYIDQLIDGDGRIPIHLFIGGDAALQQAKQKQQALLSLDLNCFLTTHTQTIDFANNEVHFANNTLSKRCFALLLDRQVGALVVVVQTDECLYESLPFDQITSITQVDNDLCSTKNESDTVTNENCNAIAKLLLAIPQD